MKTADITFRPIGVIHSEHDVPEKTPIQPAFAKGCRGIVEIFPEHASGLKDVDGFSHLYLIYHLHQAEPAKLSVKPFLQDVERGVFATRAPSRPNAIGLSIVELVLRHGNILHIRGVDILNGTPVLDIKPYSSKFDHIKSPRNGWMEEVNEEASIACGKRGYGS